VNAENWANEGTNRLVEHHPLDPLDLVTKPMLTGLMKGEAQLPFRSIRPRTAACSEREQYDKTQNASLDKPPVLTRDEELLKN
jgi:hypothetical protein